jgi:protein-S-isoprenylcysteine O-methyltransferase Ste14
LINERFNPEKGIKTWDKIYFMLSTPLYFITIILGSLDAGRYRLSPEISIETYMLIIFVYILGQFVFMWARKANNYFSTVVRIQTERGHKVCDSGPYKYVRHPGYLGSLLCSAATPAILGSIWAVIPAYLTIVLIIIRTILEDRTLEKELQGYSGYMKRVRFRLVPYVW